MKDYGDICLILVQQLCALVATCDHSTYERKGAMEDKVLVVDDELLIRNLLTDYLSGEGYEVILASNGEEACELAKTENPHVILMDIGMPGLNGIEACRRLKAEETTRYIPVVMMTGFSYDRVDAIEAGADEFIKKPIDLVELSCRLKSIRRMSYLTHELARTEAETEQLEKNHHERDAESAKGVEMGGAVVNKVLVVDDQAEMRDVLSGFLKNEGYEVLLAVDGEEAIELAKRESPHVILLDIRMPGIDGIETCRKLRADKKTHSIPVIMISAVEERSMEAIEAGADDFLSKPFAMVEVYTRVRSALHIRHLSDDLVRALAYVEELQKSQSIP